MTKADSTIHNRGLRDTRKRRGEVERELEQQKRDVERELEKQELEERKKNAVNKYGLYIYNFVYNCQTKIKKFYVEEKEEDELKKVLGIIIDGINDELSSNYEDKLAYIQTRLSEVLNWKNYHDQGWTPLMRASYNGNLDCVKMLLTINFKNYHDAAQNKYDEDCYLIDNETLDVNISNKSSNTAMTEINMQDSKGRRAIDLAYMNGKTEVVNMLLKHGATPLFKLESTAKLGTGGKKSRKRKSKRSKNTRRSRR